MNAQLTVTNSLKVQRRQGTPFGNARQANETHLDLPATSFKGTNTTLPRDVVRQARCNVTHGSSICSVTVHRDKQPAPARGDEKTSSQLLSHTILADVSFEVRIPRTRICCFTRSSEAQAHEAA